MGVFRVIASLRPWFPGSARLLSKGRQPDLDGHLAQGLGHLRDVQVAEDGPFLRRYGDHHAMVRGVDLLGEVIRGEPAVDPLGAVHSAQGRVQGP